MPSKQSDACYIADAIVWCGVSTTAHHICAVLIPLQEQRAPMTANAIKINSFIARTHRENTVLIDDSDGDSEFICVLLCSYIFNCISQTFAHAHFIAFSRFFLFDSNGAFFPLFVFAFDYRFYINIFSLGHQSPRVR